MTDASRPAVPNVIVIMADQLKATASHLWGNSFCQTPSLERLADSGVRFANAMTPHPLCVPARVSLWSARYPHSHGSRRNETLIGPAIDHAWTIWRDAGLRTALIGKNHCFDTEATRAVFDVACQVGHVGLENMPEPHGMAWYRPREGVDAAHSLRRNLPVSYPQFGYGITDAPEEDTSTGLITGQTVRFLEEFGQQPFALWVSYPDPHEPYVAPRRYADMFAPERVELPPGRPDEYSDPDHPAPERGKILHGMLGVEDVPEEAVRGAIGVYHANVRQVDDGVGEILDTLERLGIADNTIVVFTADHGEFAGEHAMFCKGGMFYDCLVHIPLIVSYPGAVAAGVVESAPANLVDVVPTLLELQGLPHLPLEQGAPLPSVVPGARAADAGYSEYGAGGPAVTQADIDALAPLTGYAALIGSLWPREAEGRRTMVRTERWKYVHDPMGDLDELYDLVADPAELTNVAGDPVHADVIAELRGRLADWALRTQDGQPVPLP